MTDASQAARLPARADAGAAEDQTPRLTPHVAGARVLMLVNPLSGSVGPGAAEEARRMLDEHGVEAEVVELEPGRFVDQLETAMESRPDVLLVLAGDGTAGTIAGRLGADGPLIAPLPGGTMNMLPRALYGTADWKAALRTVLTEGEPQYVSGGTVGGHAFYCAAILGSPALWAPAREAVRVGKLGLAWAYARRAIKRAFTGRIRYRIDNDPPRRAEALCLISPMISRAMDEPTGLEAAGISTANALDAFRLAANALFTDWRRDPAVIAKPMRRGQVWARSRIPAVLDGEPVMLGRDARLSFIPRAFRALTPRPPAAEDSV